MGLRTFTDKSGIAWRVWHVDMPSARAHLMDINFRGGWLVFEREDGLERRRLSRVPDDWGSLPPASLSALCAAADRATPARAITAQQPRADAEGDHGRGR